MPPRKLRVSPEERAMRAIDRMSAGTIAGRVESASPVRRAPDARITQTIPAAGLQHKHGNWNNVQSIPDTTVTAIDWTFGEGDEFLDTSTADEPVIQFDGFYAFTMIHYWSISAGKFAWSQFIVDWLTDVYGDNPMAEELLQLDGANPPATTVMHTFNISTWLPAGLILKSRVRHNIGSTSSLNYQYFVDVLY